MSTDLSCTTGHAPGTAGHTDLAPPAPGHTLHGVTLRPPVLHWNGTRYCGSHLQDISTQAALQVPGVTDVVVHNHFIGVVASQLAQARHARAQLSVRWVHPVTGSQPATALSDNGAATNHNENSFYQPDPAIGPQQTWQWHATDTAEPAWAIAQRTGEGLLIWVQTRYPERLKTEVAALCGLMPEAVRVLPTGPGPGEGYDAAVDAALLAMRCQRPVRVYDEPGSVSAQPVTVTLGPVRGNATHARLRSPDASIDNASPTPGAKTAAPLQEAINIPAHSRPSVAALLCGSTLCWPTQAELPASLYGQPVTTIYPASSPDYPEPAHSVAEPAWQVSAVCADLVAARVFARESCYDDLCRQANDDPVQARLKALDDDQGKALIESVARQAGWGSPKPASSGRGFACTQVIDNAQDPPKTVWTAWVAEVAVDPSGHIDLTRITVGHTAQSLQSVTSHPQLEDSVRQTAARYLGSSIPYTPGSRPAENTTEITITQPDITLTQPAGDLESAVIWNDNASLPAAAAIANAIFDATGVRLRQAPFKLDALEFAQDSTSETRKSRRWSRTLLGGIAASAAGLVVAALPWRGAIAPVPAIDTSIYSAAAVERGRLVALAGDCMVCHTAENGTPNAGGRALETPFGTVYSTNITPDRETGIGTWSFAAFERAMREGIHQDGRHLYPVFPYTAFAKLTDADMQSLYAWLMTQEPVTSTPPETELAFPYSARPLMAGWNALFHKNEIYQPDPAQTTLWNRGAYLVQGAGHCAACHSPRNSLGAEYSGPEKFLAGGFADGWEAPALNALSRAPIAWTEDSLFDYLRTGFSSLHGVASGPMGPVVQNLAQLPESDVRAMAHYLASLNPVPPGSEPAALVAARLEETSRNNAGVMTLPGEGLFEGACAMCHDAREGPPLFGARPSLALNTNMYSDHPDNIIQVILHGINDPTGQGLGHMPGFKDSLNDRQVQDLVNYMRQRFAPDLAPWADIDKKTALIRSMAHE